MLKLISIFIISSLSIQAFTQSTEATFQSCNVPSDCASGYCVPEADDSERKYCAPSREDLDRCDQMRYDAVREKICETDNECGANYKCAQVTRNSIGEIIPRWDELYYSNGCYSNRPANQKNLCCDNRNPAQVTNSEGVQYSCGAIPKACVKIVTTPGDLQCGADICGEHTLENGNKVQLIGKNGVCVFPPNMNGANETTVVDNGDNEAGVTAAECTTKVDDEDNVFFLKADALVKGFEFATATHRNGVDYFSYLNDLKALGKELKTYRMGTQDVYNQTINSLTSSFESQKSNNGDQDTMGVIALTIQSNLFKAQAEKDKEMAKTYTKIAPKLATIAKKIEDHNWRCRKVFSLKPFRPCSCGGTFSFKRDNACYKTCDQQGDVKAVEPLRPNGRISIASLESDFITYANNNKIESREDYQVQEGDEYAAKKKLNNNQDIHSYVSLKDMAAKARDFVKQFGNTGNKCSMPGVSKSQSLRDVENHLISLASYHNKVALMRENHAKCLQEAADKRLAKMGSGSEIENYKDDSLKNGGNQNVSFETNPSQSQNIQVTNNDNMNIGGVITLDTNRSDNENGQGLSNNNLSNGNTNGSSLGGNSTKGALSKVSKAVAKYNKDQEKSRKAFQRKHGGLALNSALDHGKASLKRGLDASAKSSGGINLNNQNKTTAESKNKQIEKDDKKNLAQSNIDVESKIAELMKSANKKLDYDKYNKSSNHTENDTNEKSSDYHQSSELSESDLKAILRSSSQNQFEGSGVDTLWNKVSKAYIKYGYRAVFKKKKRTTASDTKEVKSEEDLSPVKGFEPSGPKKSIMRQMILDE